MRVAFAFNANNKVFVSKLLSASTTTSMSFSSQSVATSEARGFQAIFQNRKFAIAI